MNLPFFLSYLFISESTFIQRVPLLSSSILPMRFFGMGMMFSKAPVSSLNLNIPPYVATSSSPEDVQRKDTHCLSVPFTFILWNCSVSGS